MNSERIFLLRGIVKDIEETSKDLEIKRIIDERKMNNKELSESIINKIRFGTSFEPEVLSDQLEKFINGELKLKETIKNRIEKNREEFDTLIYGYNKRTRPGLKARSLQWAWAHKGKESEGASKDLRNLLCYLTYGEKFEKVINDSLYSKVDNELPIVPKGEKITIPKIREYTDKKKKEFAKNKNEENYNQFESSESDIKYDENVEKIEEAERYWKYILNHPITKFEILFYLNSSVKYKWFVDLLRKINIVFSKGSKGISLDKILKNSSIPNTEENSEESKKPKCFFWEEYKLEKGYWCKKVNIEGVDFDVIAGFETSIPWKFIHPPKIKNLQDLALSNEVSITFPIDILNIGIKEIIFNVQGETYSFKIYLSDILPFENYHETANTYNRLHVKNKKSAIFLFSIRGIHLLELFHKQYMPGYKRESEEKGILKGLVTAKKSIHFYPNLPEGFLKTKEYKEYTYTLTETDISKIDYKGIEEDLLKKIELNKNDFYNYKVLASLYFDQKRFLDIINLISTELREKNNDPDIFDFLGTAYARLEQYEEAIDYLQRAISLSPNNYELQISIGMVLQDFNKLEEGLQYFKKVCQLDPKNARYQLIYSKGLVKIQQYSKAIIPAREAVKLDPEDKGGIYNLSLILFFNEKEDEALSFLEEIFQMDDKYPNALLLYAMIKEKKGEIEEAIEYFKILIKIENNIDHYVELGRLLCINKQWSEAESVAQDGLSIDHNHQGLLIYLCIAEANQGKLDEAMINLEKAKSINPNEEAIIELVEQIKKYRKNKEDN
jgi:tetratricopeptide (TPR) repeat protein